RAGDRGWAGNRGQRACGEGKVALSGPRCLEPFALIFTAPLGVSSAHERGPSAAQEWACDPLTRQLLLGNKGERTRDHRRKHERIEIAGMIDGEQHAACRDRFFHLDLGQQPRKPQKAACRVVDCLMAPTPARQEENNGPSHAGASNQPPPPEPCIEEVKNPTPTTAGAMAKP